jgi:dihydrofolate reductase
MNYGISRDNKMPWHFTDDLKHFNKVTLNNICIMGSTTAKDLGKPLCNRDNIVISSNDDCIDLGKNLPNYNYNDFIIVRNFESALKRATELSIYGKEIFIIGGSKLFNEALKSDKLDKIYYTHINQSFDCDNFINPILDRNDMKYEIINKIKVSSTSMISRINNIDEVELTFYLISAKY